MSIAFLLDKKNQTRTKKKNLALEYLGSISIALVASSMALPYSSNLVCAKARLAQYTAFSPFNSMACVYRSIAWEYLWALHTNSAAEKKNGINYKENNETRIKSQIDSTIYIIHKIPKEEIYRAYL